MILPLHDRFTEEELAEVRAIAAEFNTIIQPIQGQHQAVYAIIGDESPQLLINRIEGLPFVKRVDRIQVPYKLLAIENVPAKRICHINNKELGKEFVVLAGHCAIDHRNPQLFLETAHAAKEAGADAIRGGVWKPRTSPYSFQGDDKSLNTLLEARDKTGLEVITEVMELEQVQLCVDAKVDVLQIGARNALNYKLLAQVGKLTAGSPIRVLLKRGIHMGPVDEFILAAEYIAGNGNTNVFLCPRGTMPNMSGYRNHPDESITQLLKEKTWAPVIVDPSHAVGKAKYVPRAALAAASYGADGVIIETHCNPKIGIGDDPKQSITPEMLSKLIPELRRVSIASKGLGGF